jgi:uncharacterized membrane protein YqgA involved in biofilm formation
VGWLASWFVGKPLSIAAVALLFFVGFLALRASVFGAARNSRMLLLAAGGWLIYAAWEWLVQARTPEANIRVDLLVIWPVLAILSAWAVFRSLR